MANLIFKKDHNVCAFLDVQTPLSEGFRDMMTFLSNSRINFALTARPDIFENHIKQFWASASYDRDNERIIATVHDQQIIIDEATVRRVLQFGEDEEGVLVFSGDHILEVFQAFGYQGEMAESQISKVQMGAEWKFLIRLSALYVEAKGGL